MARSGSEGSFLLQMLQTSLIVMMVREQQRSSPRISDPDGDQVGFGLSRSADGFAVLKRSGPRVRPTTVSMNCASTNGT